ncbi:hypothetical protein H4Q26_001693 [Puccinia striiformis f. sp. tritici PST-130]|nr:hypothetical protein H4Q26_001693 [Puccinia striiformis f. sp. tritici PST-130]
MEITTLDLQKPPPPPPLLPHIRASILSSNSKGLNLKEIQAWLSQETNIQVCIQTVKRYLKRLNVKLLVNNVADGTVTMEQVFEAVNHARQTLLHDQAAYRKWFTMSWNSWTQEEWKHASAVL